MHVHSNFAGHKTKFRQKRNFILSAFGLKGFNCNTNKFTCIIHRAWFREFPLYIPDSEHLTSGESYRNKKTNS